VDFLERVHSMNKNFIVTGQLFFRNMKSAMDLDMSLRQVFGVSGVIAIPNECFIQGEHQYSIAGFEAKEAGGILLGLDSTTEINLESRARGCTIGQLLTEPIWKI